MTDPRSILEREMKRIEPLPFTLDGFMRRHDRKRRNQRITAGVVGIALFAVPVALVAWLSSRDRTQTPAAPGRSVSDRPAVDYVIDLNTGKKTPLPDAFTRSRAEQGTLSPGGYALSPDGSLLAYVRDGNEGTNQIFIAGIDGTQARQITNHPIGAFEPAWSPDGTKVAYTAGGPSRNLFVLDVASGESRQVTGKGLVEGPQFTPDGSSILYTRGADWRPVLKTVSVTGGKTTPLFPLGADLAGAENGSLSPDGSLVTFLEQESGHTGGNRWVANADGTQRRSLFPGCVLKPGGTWSPDGSRIVCSASGDVIVVDIATGDFTRVGEAGEAIWLDDHSLLVDVS